MAHAWRAGGRWWLWGRVGDLFLRYMTDSYVTWLIHAWYDSCIDDLFCEDVMGHILRDHILREILREPWYDSCMMGHILRDWTHIFTNRVIYTWVIWRRDGTYIEGSRTHIYSCMYIVRDRTHIYIYIAWGDTHIWSRLHKPCHLYMSHITYVWVMSRMNPSCNVKINHRIYVGHILRDWTHMYSCMYIVRDRTHIYIYILRERTHVYVYVVCVIYM